MIYKDPGFHWKGIIMRGKKLLRRQIMWLFLRTPIVVGITSFGIGQGLNPGLDREKHEVIDFETDGRAWEETELPERQMLSGKDGLPESPAPITPASVPFERDE